MTNAYDKSEQISLVAHRDLPTVTDVINSILTLLNVERIEVMEPGEEEPEIFDEFRSITGIESLVGYERHDFYNLCQEEAITLVINTGETRTFSNILLTIGVSSQNV